jgi:hypothetical protein
MSDQWYFAAGLDGEGEQTIWLCRGEGDTKPKPVFRKCDLNPDTRLMWPTIARALLETEIPDGH